MPTLQEICSAIATHQPDELPDSEGLKRAAVAAVLRDGEAGAELLFIHRAEDPRDPWSGHMAFPGGRVDPEDDGALAAALREAREEVGLDLEADGEFIGRLSDVPAVGRGRPLNMVISPFVFSIEDLPFLTPNHEVEAVVWVPVAFLADRSNRSTFPYRRYGLSLELPSYQFGEHVIWGLTFGMVDELLSIIAPESE
jgi:8-oxo-dGTP pyrophosphatase MutT (NUDIX family)